VTQVFRAGWISDYNDPYSFLELFRTGNGRNDYGYSNSTFDALLDQVGTERVRARRERLMFEAERVLMSDNVIIPVYTYVTKRLVNPQLKGWQNNVMDHHQTRHMFKLRWADSRQPVEAPAEAPAAAQPVAAEGPTAGEPSATSEEAAGPAEPEGREP
jgi:oligopeptide transport system substrate-binding protein